MIFEDAHWADPSSLEVFGRLVDEIDTLRVLLFVTFRPEFAAPWVGRPHVTALTINRLTQREVMALIDRVAGNKALPEHIRQDIVERADGIPLFVEEMTKAVLEAESEGAAARTVAQSRARARRPREPARFADGAARPARARQGAWRRSARRSGANFPMSFWRPWPKPEPELSSALDRLIQSGLLSRQGSPPHATYLFKHALVQDAAYGTLLREPRRALHARIAEALESRFPDIAESQPELLARHCTEAGLIEKAASLWGKAGLRSLARSALVEAEAQLSRGLAQIATLPTGPALRRQHIALQVGLANVQMHTRGHESPETKASFDRAHSLIERAAALGEPFKDPLVLFSILYGFWAVNFMVFNGRLARDLASDIWRLRRKTTRPSLL